MLDLLERFSRYIDQFTRLSTDIFISQFHMIILVILIIELDFISELYILKQPV